MATKPVGEGTAGGPAGGEIEHEALLVVHRAIDVRAVQDQTRRHRRMCHALVAINERVALHQREAKRRSFLSERGIQVDTAERGFGLSDSGLKRSDIAGARGAAGRFEEAAMQFHDLPEREIPHQARRRYSSSFFRSTRSAAALKSSSRVASRSAIAARARSSGARPRRSASWRSRSVWAGESSMVSFMRVLYRVPGRPTTRFSGPAAPAADRSVRRTESAFEPRTGRSVRDGAKEESLREERRTGLGGRLPDAGRGRGLRGKSRSEEHTSELH